MAEALTPPSSFDRVRQIALEVTAKNIAQTVNPNAVVEKLVAMLLRQRFYMLKNPDVVREIWDSFRRDKELTDLILNSTAELKLRLKFSNPNWNTVLNALAEAYSINKDSFRAGYCVIDEDLTYGMPLHGDLRDLLNANDWLVYLLILNTVRVDHLTGKG